MLKYKCDAVVEVCGYNRPGLDLSRMRRDDNAAKNILREGLSRYPISASVEALG